MCSLIISWYIIWGWGCSLPARQLLLSLMILQETWPSSAAPLPYSFGHWDATLFMSSLLANHGPVLWMFSTFKPWPRNMQIWQWIDTISWGWDHILSFCVNFFQQNVISWTIAWTKTSHRLNNRYSSRSAANINVCSQDRDGWIVLTWSIHPYHDIEARVNPSNMRR